MSETLKSLVAASSTRGKCRGGRKLMPVWIHYHVFRAGDFALVFQHCLIEASWRVRTQMERSAPATRKRESIDLTAAVALDGRGREAVAPGVAGSPSAEQMPWPQLRDLERGPIHLDQQKIKSTLFNRTLSQAPLRHAGSAVQMLHSLSGDFRPTAIGCSVPFETRAKNRTRNQWSSALGGVATRKGGNTNTLAHGSDSPKRRRPLIQDAVFTREFPKGTEQPIAVGRKSPDKE